jgi:morphogenetic protein associated with SpoVID
MKIHIAREGETLWDIAQKYNIPLERLQEWNADLADTEKLKKGEKIRIPTGKIPLAVSRQDTWETAGPSEVKESPKGEEEEQHIQEEEEPSSQRESSESHRFVTEELPKPPSVGEFSEWSPAVLDDSSSFMADSSYYDDEPNLSYLDSPASYPSYWHGFAPMFPVPVFQDPFLISSGWPLQPCYPPPVPMNHPDVYGNHIAMEYREWKESSSSVG